MTAAGFAEVAERLLAVADEACGGGLVSVQGTSPAEQAEHRLPLLFERSTGAALSHTRAARREVVGGGILSSGRDGGGNDSDRRPERKPRAAAERPSAERPIETLARAQRPWSRWAPSRTDCREREGSALLAMLCNT